ncbi:integumentary mucin A.1-like [Dendronephthya gigantea]|uniref:integumentary mucin A.1-like n=1 Tax=Dendronephthya gigantea TaxID=151771 RepID=UPI00106A818C|nr:integumentary mucin A.1-like [Dendronephthya gigantea]
MQCNKCLSGTSNCPHCKETLNDKLYELGITAQEAITTHIQPEQPTDVTSQEKTSQEKDWFNEVPSLSSNEEELIQGPIKPNNPWQPTAPKEPTVTSDPTSPGNPTTSREPTTPNNQTIPRKPKTPSNATAPSNSTNPSNPTAPTNPSNHTATSRTTTARNYIPTLK